MPAFDRCHPQVVRALQKENWSVQPDPLAITSPLSKRTIHIDIEAIQRQTDASQTILLAEVKCFHFRSRFTHDIYIAIGQYIIYQEVLDELKIADPLYLAVPDIIYQRDFDKTVRKAIKRHKIKLMMVNLITETIVQWRS